MTETRADRVPTVLVIGTLDTKGEECAYLRARLAEAGCHVVVIDAGILGEPQVPADISRKEVAHAAGTDLASLVESGDRFKAIETMSRGAAEVVRRLHEEGRVDGILGIGGSNGSTLVSTAMGSVPLGVPKLIVSTMAAGDTRPYVGTMDLTMMYSVVDLAGLNSVSERLLANAAGAVAGMARSAIDFTPLTKYKRSIGATMFGVTAGAVTAARQVLEHHGYEVLGFHATGSGGRSMEALMKGGHLAGVLDITTTELVDELVGGMLSAGPDRLETAGSLGLPQVVSVGALDIVSFGPIHTVPEKFRGRRLYQHNPTVTIMRTTVEECAQLGRIIADKVNRAKGPVAVFLPLLGISAISTAGGVFHDPEADRALFDALRQELDPSIDLVELEAAINDPAFGRAMAERLYTFLRAA
ncbi:MAG: Tm-1-like ATP-binding domain-containing protein [Acidimicrobiia bacterium]